MATAGKRAQLQPCVRLHLCASLPALSCRILHAQLQSPTQATGPGQLGSHPPFRPALPALPPTCGSTAVAFSSRVTMKSSSSSSSSTSAAAAPAAPVLTPGTAAAGAASSAVSAAGSAHQPAGASQLSSPVSYCPPVRPACVRLASLLQAPGRQGAACALCALSPAPATAATGASCLTGAAAGSLPKPGTSAGAASP